MQKKKIDEVLILDFSRMVEIMWNHQKWDFGPFLDQNDVSFAVLMEEQISSKSDPNWTREGGKNDRQGIQKLKKNVARKNRQRSGNSKRRFGVPGFANFTFQRVSI